MSSRKNLNIEYHALEIAQQQHAKLFELRAATSLYQLRSADRSSLEPHSLLQAAYNWFTEGFATRDLQEAHTLLAGTSG